MIKAQAINAWSKRTLAGKESTMYCYHCGNELAPNASFCGKCGNPVHMSPSSGGQNASYPGSEHRRPILGIPASGAGGSGGDQTSQQYSGGGSSYYGDYQQQQTSHADSYNSAGNQTPRQNSYGGYYNNGGGNQTQQNSYTGTYNYGGNQTSQPGAYGGPYNGGGNQTSQPGAYGGPYNSGGNQTSVPGPAYNAFQAPAAPAVAAPSLPKHLANVGTADTGSGGIRDIYIVDFLVRLFTIKENIPLCIYLLINVVIMGLVCTMFTEGNVLLGMLAGLVVYIISITVTLSPFGEWLLRKRTGCGPITDQNVAARMTPLFNEVYARAKKEYPSLPDDISLFMNEDKSPNAFATGRRTVCITRGLLNMSDDQIRGTLGHEFGHLAHKDTDKVLVISIGNTFITAICILAQIGAFIMEIMMNIFAIFMGRDGIFISIMAAISRILTIVLIGLFMKVWTGLGVLLVNKTSRGNEYQADEFSCRLGYGGGLIAMLQALGGCPKPSGLFAALASTHPDTQDRITRISHLMTVYPNH